MADHSPGTSASRLLIVGAAVAGGLTAFAVGAALKYSKRRIDEEHLASEVSNESLRRRNEQLTALYNVFSQITETLTMKYVVATTVREALRIMNADMVVLRKVEGNKLVVLSAMAKGGIEIQNMSPFEISEQGPTGRAFRTGRSVRIDEGAEQLMGLMSNANLGGPNSPSSQTGRPPLESGIVTPLIVGARVVGTLSCWAVRKSLFNDDDERIIEMMAGSVATAMVAADALTTSERRAHRDPLTDLPNRRQLNRDLDATLDEMAASKRRAVVAMVDIDHFKHFNDQFGHKIGDITLQKVASVLRKALRDEDLVYRYGGEEFVLVFMDAGAREAEALAERVRRAVEETELCDEAGEPIGPVTISIGLSILPEHGEEVGDLIELADVAMYRSKAEGRNRVTLWMPEMATKMAA